jgi:hypothetical protein
MRYDMRDEDDAVHEDDGSEWFQCSPTRSSEQKSRDNVGSKVLSSAGSDASRSLDGHKRERDFILARLELQKAQEETRRMELQLAELDAEA